MRTIVAHNVLTACRPTTWVGRLLNRWAKCQNKSIAELWAMGVRGYDIRFRMSRSIKGNYAVKVSHGLVTYDADVQFVLYYLSTLNTENEPIYIRFINEDTFHRSNVDAFLYQVKEYMKTRGNFVWQVYTSKRKWTMLCNEWDGMQVECIGSKVVPRITPRRFAKIYNAAFRAWADEMKDGFYYFDFL